MRTRSRSRLAALVLTALAWALIAGAGHASDPLDVPSEPGVTGIGRLIKYSACAAGIASGIVSGNRMQLVGAWFFCAQLYHEEKP